MSRRCGHTAMAREQAGAPAIRLLQPVDPCFSGISPAEYFLPCRTPPPHISLRFPSRRNSTAQAGSRRIPDTHFLAVAPRASTRRPGIRSAASRGGVTPHVVPPDVAAACIWLDVGCRSNGSIRTRDKPLLGCTGRPRASLAYPNLPWALQPERTWRPPRARAREA